MKFVATKFCASRASLYSLVMHGNKTKTFPLFIEVFNSFVGVCTNASHMCARRLVDSRHQNQRMEKIGE